MLHKTVLRVNSKQKKLVEYSLQQTKVYAAFYIVFAILHSVCAHITKRG